MKFLDKLKLFEKKCPVCAAEMSTIIRLCTNTDNSYSFTLKNDKYPLMFNRMVPFGGDYDSIILNDDDRINVRNIRKIDFKICGCDHYKVNFYHNRVPKLQTLANKYYPLETISAYNYVITGGLDDLEIGMIKDKSYKHLFYVNRRPASYWGLNDKNRFEEKMNKLLLLYDPR